MTQPWDDDPDFIAWREEHNRELLPKIEQSVFTMTLLTDKPPDAKIAVELGFSILLDKPLMFLVQKGTPVPKHLARVADHIVEVDLDDEATPAIVAAEVAKFSKRFGLDDDDEPA